MLRQTQIETAAAPNAKAIDPAWAWAAYGPDPKRPWNLRLAGHLYRRAAFGATWEQLQQAVADGPQRTVDKLLRPEADVDAFNRTHDAYEVASIDPDADAGPTLREWWLRRMVFSPHPLQETMTLFWRGHFGIGAAGGASGRLMQRHVGLLRRHALGSFRALLAALCRDPAVLLALECRKNHKARPNEDFARAIVEVLCVGPGACSPADIREAARALTGYGVLRNEFHYSRLEHDDGVKQIFGREGPFGGDDLVEILLAHPATPRFLVRKLYRWLISEEHEPSDELLAPLAQSLAKDYDLARPVETMLRSNLFFSPMAYRRRIKSPVEYALGIVKGFGELVPTGPLGYLLTSLGQDIIQPPTIKGWQGGRLWINRPTLMGRSNLAHLLVGGSPAYAEKLNPAALVQKHGRKSPESAGRFLLDLFLQGDLPPGLAEKLAPAATAIGRDPQQALRQLVYAIVTLPAFQMA
jgi:uncharacterized protein (DUF1800 family)